MLIKKLKTTLRKSFIESKLLNNLFYFSPIFITNLRKINYVTLEVSSACNLKCLFCPVGSGKVKPGIMDLKTHNKIIDLLPQSVKRVSYSFRGEPLTNPDLPKMIKYSYDKGLLSDVCTNGMLLDKYIDALVNSGLDRLTIAIDGATQKTQSLYRVNSNIDKIKNNIRMIVEKREKSKNKFPTDIFIQTVISSYNEHEIEDMQKLAKKLKVDKIKFKTIAISFGANYEKDLEEQKKFLPKNKNYWRKENQIKTCPFVWETVIYYNGDVSICCSDYLGEYIIGNVLKENNFNKVYYSKKYNKIRKKIIKRKLKICKDCPITGDYLIPELCMDFK